MKVRTRVHYAEIIVKTEVYLKNKIFSVQTKAKEVTNVTVTDYFGFVFEGK